MGERLDGLMAGELIDTFVGKWGREWLHGGELVDRRVDG